MTNKDRKTALIDRLEQLDELETRRAEESLHVFIRAGWHVLEPSRPFIDNWHISGICEHLGAMTAGRIQALVINVPPETSKSYLVSVFWPAWEWIRRPDLRYLCASHDQSLSTRDAVRVRDLVTSAWYQQRWPHVQLREDQNTKTRFDTTRGGWRISTSVGGAGIGEHPDRKILDDVHKPNEIPSETERLAVQHWYDQTISTRGVAQRAATVLIGQRLHEDDLSGYLLAKGSKTIVHVVLPMRYEPGRMRPTPLGWTDPRREPGELLWPARFPREVVDREERENLGPMGTAAQYQQHPVPPGGYEFQAAWLKDKLLGAEPAAADVVSAVRFWDVAGTEGGSGPRTAGLRMVLTRDGRYVVTSVHKDRWASSRVHDEILAMAGYDGPGTAVREEQEPGSSGKAVIEVRRLALAGYDYEGVPSTGDKVTRARPLAVQMKAGTVYLAAPPDPDGRPPRWVREFIDELGLFPHGRLKDQVDAASGAFGQLALGGVRRRVKPSTRIASLEVGPASGGVAPETPWLSPSG